MACAKNSGSSGRTLPKVKASRLLRLPTSNGARGAARCSEIQSLLRRALPPANAKEQTTVACADQDNPLLH